MRFVISTLILMSSVSAFAQNNCEKWVNKDRYTSAIKAVAKHEQMTFEELCVLPKVLDIEVSPTHIVTPQGDVIPHTRVQLHMSYESCLYMVRDADKVITSNNCYSGW